MQTHPDGLATLRASIEALRADRAPGGASYRTGYGDFSLLDGRIYPGNVAPQGIDDMTMTNPGTPGEDGGAIRNRGTLLVEDCSFQMAGLKEGTESSTDQYPMPTTCRN